MAERKTSIWYCVSCNHVLGEVIGGEFHPDAALTGDKFQTRGPNLVVSCPQCDHKKVWYTADPIVRSMYQLVDSIVEVAAKRMVFAIGKRTMHEMAKFKEVDES